MLERLLANWPLKLLAVALAFAIWVSVTGETVVVQDFTVPLELQLPETKMVASSLPTTVTVRLRGQEGVMRRFDPVPMALRVDLRGAQEGEQDVQLLSRDLVGVPREVEVDFIDPDRLNLKLDERLRVELPVEPTFLGQPPEGFTFYGARVRPDTVVVEGPKSQLSTVEVLRTNPIRLDNRTEPFSLRVTAVPEDSYVRMLDPGPIEVAVDVDASPVERAFDEVPVVVRGGTGDDHAEPSTVRVVLSGPPRLIDALAPEQVAVIADVTRLEPGTVQDVPLEIDLSGISSEEQSRISVKSMDRHAARVRLAGRVT